jgi:hypothetical protein
MSVRPILIAALTAAMILGLWTAPAKAQMQGPTFDRDLYTFTSWETTIKTLWRLNVLSLNKDEDIDNTLRVLECPIYHKYTRDDFEWQKIRAAMRKEIEASRSRWPLMVKFMQPVQLDDYNFDRKIFPLKSGSKYEGVYRLQIAAQSPAKENICTADLNYGIANMPHNASIRLPRAFKMTEIPVEDEIAEVYIDRVAKLEEQDGRSHREAYIVFYVTLERYLDQITDSSGVKVDLAEFAGKIDRIEVYADQQLTLPLHYKSDIGAAPNSVLPSGDPDAEEAPKPALIDTSKAIGAPGQPTEQPAAPQ